MKIRPLSSVRRLVGEPNTLRRRAAATGAWNIAELGFGSLLRLASNLIMSRLLLPEAFGLMAMVMTLLTAMELFTDIGIRQSVIRSPRGDDPRFLRAAWTIQLLRRALVVAVLVVFAGVLLWLLAPALAPRGTVYAEPDLPPLILVSSLLVVLKGFESTNAWLAARQLQYARIALLNVASQVIALSAMLALASIHASAWTLLAGTLIGAAVKTILSHRVLPGPTMAFVRDKTIEDELWYFGRWIVASSSLGFAAANADKLILGALLGSQVFGHYIIAMTWVAAASMFVARFADAIVFPVLSEIQRARPEELQRVLGRASLSLDGILLLICIACFLVVPVLIRTLYSVEYMRSAEMVPILSLVVLNVHFSPLGKLLLAKGDSKSLAMYSATNAVLLCIGLPLGYYCMGVGGALFAVVGAPTVASMVYVFRASASVSIPIGRELMWVAGILALGIVILLARPL